MIGTGRHANAARPRRGPGFALWAFIAPISVIFGLVTVWQSATLLFGTSGTGRVLRCGRGDNRYCTVEWTAGGRSGMERMEMGGDPGGTVPVRVLGDNVVQADVGNWIFTIAMMLLFTTAAVVTVLLPLIWGPARSWGRRRAERRMRASGEHVLHVRDAEIRTGDGALFARFQITHPGPDFPPSSCRVTVTSPEGSPYYRVDFGVADRRRREMVVYGADGRPL
ncbi:hypothetical protein ACFQ07_21815, partial [Actinomadura adrarensis]